MKKIFYLLPLIAALVTACGGGQKGKEFTVNGKFADSNQNGKAIYLQSFNRETGKLQPMDTVVVAKRAFTITGRIDSTTILYITGTGLTRPHMFIGEEGVIEMSFDQQTEVKVKGTPLNDSLQQFMDKSVAIQNKLKQISLLSYKATQEGKLTPEYEKQLENRSDSLYNEQNKFTFDFVKTNANNLAGQFVFLDRGRSFDQSQLEQIIPLLGSSAKMSPKFKKIQDRLNVLQATAVGKKFTDLKAPAPDGKEIALSDYAGKDKYVLIDFWASWCPPCREEAPELVKVYNQYKSKGFEIVGVSLDNKKESWEKGIKDLKLSWPQMSDIKYWDTELGAAYAVNNIPYLVLLDKDGTILAKGITVQELSDKLAELLK